jgi:acetyl esterase
MLHLALHHRLQARAARALLSLPDRALLAMSGGRPFIRDGLVLDPQVQLLLTLQRRLKRPLLHQLSVAGARRELEVNCHIMAPAARPLADVRDDTFPGPAGKLPVRIYRPHGVPRPAPALVYFHGGGFVTGSLESHDHVCRLLADEARCVVIAVDYRMAPEHRFPAAPDDALAAFRHVASHTGPLGLDPVRLAIGGDSAGGNLSAVVALATRADAVRPAFQLLIYPATDMTMSFPSIETMGHGLFLERATMDWFLGHYVPNDDDRRDPRASPWFDPDVRGAPPACIVTAGFDPLRDEGEAYARKLRDAGVPVALERHTALFHGFISVCGGLSHALPPVLEMAAAVRRALA